MNLKAQKETYKKQTENPTKEDIKQTSFMFAVFSANIRKFYSNISSNEIIDMFKKFMYYRKSSNAEQYDIEYLRSMKIINNSSINIETKNITSPTIFASFHLGSYRLFNSYLYELGYKIVIIIDETVFLNQQDNILNKVKPLLKGTKNSDLILLNVNDRTSIFKLKNYIEQGYVMTVYLDGNTGLNEKSQDFSKGYISINFLNSQLFVKNGIGKLATLLSADIIPTISYRDDNDISYLEFHKVINTNDFENRQEFSVKSIEICYKKLEEKLIDYSTQWECWGYIQKWFKRGGLTPFYEINLYQNKFNLQRYITFKLDKSNFIFDLLDYQSYPIEQELANAIQENNFSKINKDLIQELQDKNIII